MEPRPHFEITRADNGEWFWRLVDSNQRIVANAADTYTEIHDARRALANVLYDIKDRKNFDVHDAADAWLGTPGSFVHLYHRSPK